jgi:hypothetical protein
MTPSLRYDNQLPQHMHVAYINPQNSFAGKFQHGFLVNVWYKFVSHLINGLSILKGCSAADYYCLHFLQNEPLILENILLQARLQMMALYLILFNKLHSIEYCIQIGTMWITEWNQLALQSQRRTSICIASGLYMHIMLQLTLHKTL